MEAMQGRVPGLEITQVNGQPGSAFNLKIRGATNFFTTTTTGVTDASQLPNPLVMLMVLPIRAVYCR